MFLQRLTSKKMIWSMESMVKGSTAGHIHIRPTCFSITSEVSMWNFPHVQRAGYGKSEIVLPHSLLHSHLHSTLRLSRLTVIELEGDWFDLSWLSFLYISLLLMYFFLPFLQSLPLASSSHNHWLFCHNFHFCQSPPHQRGFLQICIQETFNSRVWNAERVEWKNGIKSKDADRKRS